MKNNKNKKNQDMSPNPYSSNRQKFIAISVHLFTAFGIVCSLYSLLSVFNNDIFGAFMWLGIAIFIDSIDGTLARKAEVSKILPNINGLMMDSIVDFINYVFIPIVILLEFGLLLSRFDEMLAISVLLISLFSYSRKAVADADFRYTGFPVAWNVVVVYLHIFETGQLFNTIVISLFIALKFVPLKYVHPFRTLHLRSKTLIASVVWFASVSLLCLEKEIDMIEEISVAAAIGLAYATLYFAIITISSIRELSSASAKTEIGISN